MYSGKSNDPCVFVIQRNAGAERFGISASDVTYDYGKIVAYKEETTDKLVQGVEHLLKANGVDVYDGKGTLLEEKKCGSGKNRKMLC